MEPLSRWNPGRSQPRRLHQEKRQPAKCEDKGRATVRGTLPRAFLQSQARSRCIVRGRPHACGVF